jgi:Fibronectin type III-like domain
MSDDAAVGAGSAADRERYVTEGDAEAIRGATPRCRPKPGRPDARRDVAPGQVTIQLDARAFSYWSDTANAWRVVPGCDTIAVGSSSRQLPLSGLITQGGASCPGG